MVVPVTLRTHALGLAALGAMTSILMVTPVLPLVLDRRGLPPSHVGGVVGVMSLALVVAEVLVLGVTSRLDRRRAAAIAFAGSAVMLAWFPHTATLPGLYLNRIVFGGVRGVLWPVMFSEVAESSPPERRATTFAIFWLYFGMGLLIGPALGGWLADRISLNAPFYAAAALSLLTLPVTLAIRPVRDPAGVSPLRAFRELVRQAPAVPRSWALTACNVMVFSVYATFLPLHAAAHGLSAAQIGLIFTGGALAFIAGQDVLRRAGHRLSPERLLVPALALRGLGVLAVPFLSAFWPLLLVNAVSGVFGAAIPNALSTRIAGQAPREYLVAAMGGFNAAADLGFFLGPVVGGVLAGFGLRWAFVMVLPVTALALGLAGARSGHQAVGDHRREEQGQVQHGVSEQADR